MFRPVLGVAAAAVLLGTFAAPASAQRGRAAGAAQGAARPAAMSDSALLASLQPRSIGPAVMSGRISDVAVPDGPRERAAGRLGKTIYAAAASGGVWKSTNGGTTWEPIFDEYGTSSIGDVAVAPSNSEIVWVGTGEQNNLRSSSWGDGIYKSVNGGRSFTHMGLRGSQHIGRVVVHPTNADIVWVAAAGPLWGEGGERGVFKTTDGGKTWKQTLAIDQYTGVTDIAMDPSDPDVLYAAAYQRERKAYSFIGGGPGSGIHKSTDGGETWRRVDAGLPTDDMGRIGLDVCAKDPRTVYAVVHAEEGGVFRSDNHGESWTRTSDVSSIPWFFGQIRVDPTDCDRVYHLGVRLQRSEDGGRTFQPIARQVHADQHAMWIDPTDPDHIVLGNDGGLYITYDRGETWNFSENLPISQFYAIGVDMQDPYHVYGGLQDNSTWGGPSRTRARTGIRNADWIRTSGGDGFYAAIDPIDPNIIFSESQNGGIVRFDRRTGERKSIKPQPKPGEPAYRWNWSAPILISPHDPATIWFAANHLFRSPDRGDSWVRLGPDLTRQRDRDSIPMMGKVWGREGLARHEGVADYGNISTLDESPLKRGLLYVGTDDGLIQVSEDGGATWRRIERFPTVPEETYVSRVVASKHHEGTVYATFDGHRSNDFRPYVLKSTDYGRTWRPITANLPASGSTHVIREHHRNPNLLFVGTEFGVFFSVDGGGSWTQIDQGIPTAIVHDLIIHPRENDLIVGTHGRGIYIIDDITPLEQLATARQAQLAHLYPVKPATLMSYSDAVPGPRGSGAMADRGWSAPNPPLGATIAYFVKEGYPRNRALSLSIVDRSGQTIRELQARATPGIHRVQWDLRHAPSYTPPRTGAQGGGGQGDGGGGGGGGGFGGGGGGGGASGPFVLAGEYVARLEIAGAGADAQPIVLEQPVIVRADPLVTLTVAQHQELFETRMRASRMQGVAQMMLRNAEQAKAQVTEARAALREMANAPAEVVREAAAIDRELDEILRSVRGGGQQRARGGDEEEEEEEERGGTQQQAVLQRLNGAASQIGNVTSLPTEQQREMLSSAIADLEKEVERLNALLPRIPALQVALEKAGAPWTVGRPVAWPEKP